MFTFKSKKLVAALTSLACAMPTLACGGREEGGEDATPLNTVEYNIPQDYCRTYYEIFVRSFADGNGDGIGDLRGLINNLDYLNDGDDSTTTDLGVNGIWLMPIHKSPSYHKYDVADYYSIDPQYGTMSDFEELVSECNKRGIWIQIDLVLNHTSIQHPWFQEAINEAKLGNEPEDSFALQRYNIIKQNASPGGKYCVVPGTERNKYWYLGNFSSDMPEPDLSLPEVREEITHIVDFWLDKGVRSFRLDAVPWACANSVTFNSANNEFWTWFNNYCNTKGAEVFGAPDDGIDRYCYNVGEVFTSVEDTLNSYFGTGMSNFNFAMGGSASVGFARAVNNPITGTGAVGAMLTLQRLQAAALEKDEHAILSNFLSNHDNPRSAGFFMYDPVRIKKAAALYLLAPGNPYIYYGEEIGMYGSSNDPDKRMPFVWGDSDHNAISAPPGSTIASGEELGSVASMTNKSDSVLTFYRRAIRLRNIFPEIGRGIIAPYALNAGNMLVPAASVGETATAIVGANEDNKNIAAYTLTYKNSTITIVHNIGTAAITLDVSGLGDLELCEELKACGGSISLSGGRLRLPEGGVAVLRSE